MYLQTLIHCEGGNFTYSQATAWEYEFYFVDAGEISVFISNMNWSLFWFLFLWTDLQFRLVDLNVKI